MARGGVYSKASQALQDLVGRLAARSSANLQWAVLPRVGALSPISAGCAFAPSTPQLPSAAGSLEFGRALHRYGTSCAAAYPMPMPSPC